MMHDANGVTAEEAARSLNLTEQRPNVWKGACPACGKYQFWIKNLGAATGWNCSGCGIKGTDFSRIPELRRPRKLLLTVDELLNRPPRTDLIQGVLPEVALAVLYGHPESKKTFVALDWALCVAAGRPWHGHEVRPGPVVYVAAEGQDKLAKRIAAWMSYWDVRNLSRLRIVETCINLLERQEVEELIAEVQEVLGPSALIVFDTLHRSMAGGDENSAKDIGIVIDHVDRFRHELGCAALLLHHPGYSSSRPRGSSSLTAALDTSVHLRRSGDALSLACEKSKDSVGFETIHLRTVEAEDSLVVLTASSGAPASTGKFETLLVLAEHAEGLTATEWCEASDLASSTFYNHRGALKDAGFIELDGEGRGAHYTVTSKGHEVLTPFANQLPESSDSFTSCHAPPFRGAGGESLEGSSEGASEGEDR